MAHQSCQLCNNETIDSSLPRIEAVCANCGLVIQHDSVVQDWLSLDESTHSAEYSKDWLDVSTVRNATEEQLVTAFDAIENIGDQVEIPEETRKEAARVYSEVFLAGVTDGRDTSPVVAACVRLGSIRANQAIPLGKLVSCVGFDKHKLNSSLSVVKQSIDQPAIAPRPTDYVWFLSNGLSVSHTEKQKIKASLQSVDESPSLTGKDPAAIAAAVAYLVVSECTQSAVADVVGVSTETIRKRKKQLQELMINDE